jgi:hypothetical protein
VLTVDEFAPKKGVSPYLDQVDAPVGAIPTNAFFAPESSTLLPFTDARLVRNSLSPSAEDPELDEALSLLTGSTANYVSYKQRSATCGWDYDSTTDVGTDSIAFGGRTY